MFNTQSGATTAMAFSAATFFTVALSAEPVNYNRDIRPILSDKCFACHGPDKQSLKGDLRLDARDVAIARKAIVPGKPGESELVERILSHDADLLMPPAKSNKSLTDAQKELLKKWIEEGAEYHPHWSFVPIPKSVPQPRPADPTAWIRSPIDAFILDRLRKSQIEPAKETSKEKWLRRVSFDLTGLPPTLEELDAFLADHSTNAYESAADRLLASTAFGERIANEWLDVARYADTFGYQADRDTHVWPWRDWVIRAFNQNLPYDQFIIWQTAGDLLPNATRDQRLATAFNRLHRQTNEGGSIEEEFRQAYIADRVVTNGTAFLGLTFECARCHNHKYDPISQEDFYRLAAFYSNIDEHGLYSHFTETAPTPTMLLYDGEQQAEHSKLIDAIKAKQNDLNSIREQARERFANHPFKKANIHDAASLASALSTPGSTSVEPKLYLPFDGATVAGENKLVDGIAGQAVEFSGEDAFVCKGSGEYGRATPFSISFWLKPSESKPRTILLHQCVAAEDAAFRGYSLVLDSGHLQFSLIHFWPGNAIQVRDPNVSPLNEWTHVVATYDGSSSATGARLYANGIPVQADVIRDQLTRDFRYLKEWGDSNSGIELSLGARFRDSGFRHGAIDELRVFDQELTGLEVAHLNLATVSHSNPKSVERFLSTDDFRFEHYLTRFDEPYRAATAELAKLRSDENAFSIRVRQIMVMRDALVPRPVHVLKRGAYDSPAQEVVADVPSNILPFPSEYPRNRLGLAKWMTDDRNPLTSRVAVNRFWSLFFGRGLVPSLEDFGGQGQPPSHPELLDWLSRHFMETGWNVKQLCKQIVLSATYRQSSVPRDPKTYHLDPENLLLARGPRYRLPAEQLRDNALAVSGLLVAKSGGPSVMPYQPAGLWEESGTGKSYKQSTGEGLYRRSMYTFWRRTSPPPSMLTFDATGREVCTARRERTATPLQSLVTLNDPQFVEASRVLAERLLKQPGAEVGPKIEMAFRLLTSRRPSDKELKILTSLYEDQKTHFNAATDDARHFLATGDAPRDEQLNVADHAALAVVVNAIFNFDECVFKR